MLGRGDKAKVGLGSECNPVSKASVALTRTVKRVAHRCGGEKPHLDRAALGRRVRSFVGVVRRPSGAASFRRWVDQANRTITR